MINSVNGEKHKLETVLPLVKEHDAAVIGLTMDDNGIPSEAEKRLEIARLIADITESTPFGLILAGLDGLIVLANRTAEEVLAVEQGSLPGRGIWRPNVAFPSSVYSQESEDGSMIQIKGILSLAQARETVEKSFFPMPWQ